MIDSLIQKAKQQYGCVSFEGASDDDIKQANEFIQSMGFAPLPQDFINFLQICSRNNFDDIN